MPGMEMGDFSAAVCEEGEGDEDIRMLVSGGLEV